MNFVWLISAVAILVVSAHQRSKRILFGDIIHSFGNEYNVHKWKSPYEAIYYSVAIKPGWGKVAFSAEWDDPHDAWDMYVATGRQNLETTRNNRCGGSFLTATVVQTACHCVAHFYGDAVTAKAIWEEPMVVYASVGHTRKGDPFGMGVYSSKRYYAHILCRLWRQETTRIISYDYALISLAKGGWGATSPASSFDPGSSQALYRLAPLYTAQDLDKHYLNILSRQSICLFIGHGYTTLGNDSGLMSIERLHPFHYAQFNPTLGILSFTWRTITGYRFCHDFLESVLNYTKFVVDKKPDDNDAIYFEGPDQTMNEPLTENEEVFHPGYTKEATFTCSMNAGKFQAIPIVGDGGYPVTCNNVYFAVQGVGWTKWNRMDRMSLESAITFAKWENAAEFRDDLILKMDQWSRETKRIVFDERITGDSGSSTVGNSVAVTGMCFFGLVIRLLIRLNRLV